MFVRPRATIPFRPRMVMSAHSLILIIRMNLSVNENILYSF